MVVKKSHPLPPVTINACVSFFSRAFKGKRSLLLTFDLVQTERLDLFNCTRFVFPTAHVELAYRERG